MENNMNIYNKIGHALLWLTIMAMIAAVMYLIGIVTYIIIVTTVILFLAWLYFIFWLINKK